MPIDIKKNIDEIREDFPMLKKKPHYLSSCGRGPQPRQSYEAMREYIKTEMMNGRAEGKMKEYRENAAKLINAKSEEISFAKTTTEGLCMFATAISYEPGQNIVITDLNFPSNSMIWYHLARRKHLQVREARAIPYEEMTEIPPEVIADQVDKNTRVISVDHCIFSNGYRMDLEELAKIAHEVGAYLIVDGVQALGAITLDVRKTNIDAYSTAGYKYLLAPRGSALFFVSNRIIEELQPIHVGPHGIKDFRKKISYDLSSRHYTRPYYDLAPNASKFELATENQVGIVGLNESIKYFLKIGPQNIENYILDLEEYFIDRLQEKGYKINSSLKRDVRGASINFVPKKEARAVSKELREDFGIATRLENGLRVGPHLFNREEDFDALLATVEKIERSL